MRQIEKDLKNLVLDNFNLEIGRLYLWKDTQNHVYYNEHSFNYFKEDQQNIVLMDFLLCESGSYNPPKEPELRKDEYLRLYFNQHHSTNVKYYWIMNYLRGKQLLSTQITSCEFYLENNRNIGMSFDASEAGFKIEYSYMYEHTVCHLIKRNKVFEYMKNITLCHLNFNKLFCLKKL